MNIRPSISLPNLPHPRRVGVLMGGMGREHEVSFNSGRTIVDHLTTSAITPVPLFHTQEGHLYILPYKFLHRGKIADFHHRLPQEARRITWSELSSLVDVIYIALHGRFAEDGTVQGMLELCNIPYVGSGVRASALGMHKSVHKRLLHCAGICVPTGHIVPAAGDIAQTIAHITPLNYPLVVKPSAEGSSLGVTVVYQPEDLIKACTAARHVSGAPQDIIIEAYITGIEFTSTIVQQPDSSWQVLGITHIETPAVGFWDYTHKYMPGLCRKWTPARISCAQQDLVEHTVIRVATILGMRDIARIDGFITPDGITITDPNTLSGSAPSSPLFEQAAVAHIPPSNLIVYLASLAYTRGTP